MEKIRPIRHRLLTPENHSQKQKSVLIVQAHPDDLVLGGGIHFKLKDVGVRVQVATLTDGGAGGPEGFSPEEVVQMREWEDRRGCEVGGAVTDLYNLRLPFDSSLEQHIPEGLERLSQVVKIVKPDVLLVTNSKDKHPDHRAAAEIARLVAVEHGGIAVYEIGISTSTDHDGNALAITHVLPLTGEEEAQRKLAFLQHVGQIRRATTPAERVAKEEVLDMTKRDGEKFGEEHAAVVVFDAKTHGSDPLVDLLQGSVRILDRI